MSELPRSLLKQFAKTVNQSNNTPASNVMIGTLVKEHDVTYVRIDGSNVLTPASMAMSGEEGDRVMVTIQNHTAIVTANITAPAATTKYVERVQADLTIFKDIQVKDILANYIRTDSLDAESAKLGYVKADEIDAKVGEFGYLKTKELEAETGKFGYLKTDDLEAENAKLGYLKANELDAESAKLGYVKADEIDAKVGEFGYLKTKELEAETGKFGYLKTDDLEAENAKLGYLKANELDAESAKLGYLKADDARMTFANIDLANVNNAWIQNGVIVDGSIGSAAIHDGAITNVKIADATIEAAKIKSINADVITSGTIKTNRLVITDEDGNESIVKAINMANGIPEAEVNSRKIQAASIEVIDLSAFEAKIAGFNMDSNSIYSGKESIKDPKSGIYISTTGVGMGDGSLTGKKESPLQAYADGSFKLTGKNSSFDFNTVTGELNIEATNLKISAKSVATKEDVDQVRDEITTLLRIESSRGTVFKNDQVATVLSVVLYHGKQRITDAETMKDVFGPGAYLQWYWQRLDDDSFGILSNSDSRFGDEGFTFTLSPDDVDTKVTFMCELIV